MQFRFARTRNVAGKLKAFFDVKGGLTRGVVPDPDGEIRRLRRRLQKARRNLEKLQTPQGITDSFHRLYHGAARKRGETWRNTRWFGIPTQKCPLDMWIYQEILHETRPDVIVESGTACGGSALYMAHILDALGSGEVITVDIEERPGRPEHERITYLTGSSTSEEIVQEVRDRVEGKRAMVVLDSYHGKEHVAAELELYWPLVAVGCYLIVEDTNLGGNPVSPNAGPGPMAALQEFLEKRRNRFVTDPTREKLMLTFNPKGYLRRVG